MTTEINITGGTPRASRLVTAVIARALEDSGFETVSVLNPLTNAEVEVGDAPTLMDVVRQHNPEIFTAPVTIWQHRPARDDYEVETPEGLPSASEVALAEAEADALDPA